MSIYTPSIYSPFLQWSWRSLNSLPHSHFCQVTQHLRLDDHVISCLTHTRNTRKPNYYKKLPVEAFYLSTWGTGLEIATDTVANVTNIFSSATKNSGLVATLATRFLNDLDLNSKRVKLKQTFHLMLLCFHHKKINVPNPIDKASLPPNLYRLLSAIFSNNQIWWITLNYRASER